MVYTCAYAHALSFNAASDGGRAIMALALSPRAAGALVTARGAGTCGTYGGAYVEDWGHGPVK